MRVDEFQDFLNKDLAWRKMEISQLFGILSTAESKSVVCKSMILLLYAHWEGFIKKSSKCYLKYVSDKNIKIVEAEVVDVADDSVEVGKVCEVTKKYFVIKCGEKGLKIKKLQPEGKKLMDTVAFLNGYKLEVGM